MNGEYACGMQPWILHEGYWRNGAMEREGKGAFIAMLFAIISSCNIYIYEVKIFTS